MARADCAPAMGLATPSWPSVSAHLLFSERFANGSIAQASEVALPRRARMGGPLAQGTRVRGGAAQGPMEGISLSKLSKTTTHDTNQ